MPVSETLSRKISVLSFVAMASVVICHHSIVGNVVQLRFGNLVVQSFVHGLALFAVPFFFVMSGFWFAHGAYVQGESEWQGVGKLWCKKVRMLLVPYLLWGLLGAILLVPTGLFSIHVQGEAYARTFLGIGGFWKSVDAVFGLARLAPISNGALWYVRVLLMFFLFAPLWRVLFRVGRWLPLLLGLAFILLPVSRVSIPYVVENLAAFGWLLLGMGLEGWIAENRRLPRSVAVLCGVVWFALMVVRGVRYAEGLEVAPIFSTLISLFAIAFFWSIADWAPLYRAFMKPTFWVYCLHGPLTEYFRSGTWFLFGKGDASTLFTLFGMSLVTLAVCLGLAYALQRLMPRLYALLSGGRV